MEMYCVLGYVTRESMKFQHKADDLTQKAIGDRCQAFQNAEIKSRSDHESENQSVKQSTITRNKTPCIQNTAQSSRKQILDENNNDSNSHLSANVSMKRKQRKFRPSKKMCCKDAEKMQH